MLYTLGWNIMCIHNIIPHVLSVGFLAYSVAHSIYHKQRSVTMNHIVRLSQLK